jgi:hypothetical protein
MIFIITISKKSSNGLQSIFINLQYTINCDQLLNYFIGFCAAFGSLRFIKLLRFSKNIIVFLLAFKKSLKELMSFGLIFFILLLSFVQAIYIIMNNKSIQFATFLSTLETCFQIILGKFNSDTFYHSDTFLGPAIFISFNICIVFIMISTFISILIENYNLAQNDHELDEEDPELFNYLRSLLVSVLFCFSKNKETTSHVYVDYWDSLPSKFDGYFDRMKKVYLHV